MRVLLLFAHPAFEKSRVHRALLRAARTVNGVTIHDLYEQYPDGDIDIAREQALLLEHEVIVLQHPFYWYSVPPLLKQWFDLVLEHGWAYGSRGTQLHGKRLQVAMTAGGGAAAYAPEGFNGHTFREFLLPVEATARLCGLHFEEPWIIPGTHAMTPEGIADAAERYRLLLTSYVSR